MGTTCCSQNNQEQFEVIGDTRIRKQDENNYKKLIADEEPQDWDLFKIENWDLLQIIKYAIKETCPTSEGVDQLASILVDLVLDLNSIDFKISKDKVNQLFDWDLSREVRESYHDDDQKEKFNYNKIIQMYKEKYNISDLSQQEQSRIFHSFASHLYKIGWGETLINYNQQRIDELVQLQCIESLMEKTGEKLSYAINQLQKETQRMKSMLKETFIMHGKRITQLKFDLEDKQEYLLAAEISRYACQYHENGIYFLIVYLKRGFEKLELKGRGVKKIEEITNTVLDELQVKYRPGQSLSDLQKYKESFSNLEFQKPDINYNKYKFQEGDKYDQLLSIIIHEASIAGELKQKFQTLITKSVLKNSLWSKTGLKINPNNPNKKSLIRTIEKLLFKKTNNLITLIDESCSKDMHTKLKREQEEYKNRILEILESKDEIEFIISDMLRGKCIFLTINDILIAIGNIKEFIQRNKDIYELVEVENRFNSQIQISDFTLKIHIDQKTIAELQLSLQDNQASYNFAHKGYELGRSKVFSKIKIISNYYQEYRQLMTEMIIGQVQNKMEFNDEEKTNILCYFLINSQMQCPNSLENILIKKIQKFQTGERFCQYFFKRFKLMHPAMSMVLCRKLGMIDQNKVEITKNEHNLTVRSMMILQIMKFWNPNASRTHIQNFCQNHKIFEESRYLSFRNTLLFWQFERVQAKIEHVYGYYSLEMGKYFFEKALDYQENQSHPQNACKYYQKAKQCLQNSEFKNIELQQQIRLRFFAILFKMGIVSKQTVKQLEQLLVTMKFTKNYYYALAIQLLLSQYYLVYELNKDGYLRHYESAQKMSRIQGIPFAGELINDIEWGIRKHNFLDKGISMEQKKLIFDESLSKIIAQFGSYKKFYQLFQILKELEQQLTLLGIQLSQFKPNRFQTQLNLRKLTEYQWKLFSKMSFENLQNIKINQLQIEGKTMCEYLSNSKCSKLKKIVLSQSQITDEAIKALSKANWPKLYHLDLSQNLITDQGIKILCQAKFYNLQTVYLYENKITDQGVHILTGANWPKLHYLFLRDNLIQKKVEGYEILKQIFPRIRDILL